MAPIQQQSNESSFIDGINEANSLHLEASSKVQKSKTKISSSLVSQSSSQSSVSSESNKDTRKTSFEGRKTPTMMEWPHEKDSFLSIVPRGLFYSDSFFEDIRKDFNEAMKDVLDQWGHRSQQIDDLTSYRKLRELNLQEKNQAVSVSQDDNNHKVVMDVRDFMNDDVKVKVMNENELVVEGNFEKQDGGCVSKKSFRRSFLFPGLVKTEAVSSAMSSDGVLTVTVPKINQKRMSSKLEDSSRINLEQVNESTKKNVYLKGIIRDDSSKSVFDDINPDSLLPIMNKGLFFRDSFFESTRKDFEMSVQEILKRFGDEKSETKDSDMATYRNLREKNLKEENQAISVTQDNDHHKVVLDVKDFMNGDVTVQIVDENELKIEGKIEKRSEGMSSLKSFHKSFTFPGLIRSDAVSSAMSSDGVLTVTIPKEKQNVMLENSLSSDSVHSKKLQQTSDKFKTITASEKVNSNSNDVFESHVNNISKCLSLESTLPLFKKGLFFHDDVFKSVRKDFENAVNEVLKKSGETIDFTDNLSSYWKLRDRDLKEENQAMTTSEDHQCHKVLIDVRDFMQNDLKVKMVDENQLIVEGKMEKKDGSSISAKTFCRNFVFPGLINSEAVSSTMSSDGILIITVPKNTKEQRSPLSVQSRVNESTTTSTHLDASKIEVKRNISSQTFQKSNVANSEIEDQLNLENVLKQSNEEFFDKTCMNFEKEAKTVLDNFDEYKTTQRKRDPFRTSQKVDFTKEKHMMSMSETDHSHKVEIDVRDFVGEDLQVKLLEQNEVLVEGSLEMEENGTTSNKTFCRRIQLPGVVREDDVTSVLSKDGTLVITAKKDPKYFTGKFQSESVEETETKSENVNSSSQQIHSSEYSSSNYSHSSSSQQLLSSTSLK